MANIINGDNGSVSGTAGLKSSSDGTGVLALQTNGTTALSIDASQNTTLAGTLTIGTATQAVPSGTAPLYAARAWVKFNGTGTVTVNGSGNVSSITDNATGSYTMNFTTSMPDINYSVTGISSFLIGVSETIVVPNFTPPGTETASTAASFKFATLRPSVSTAADVPFVYLSVFR